MSRQDNYGLALILDEGVARLWRDRFPVVVLHERGICYVIDSSDDSMLTFTQFKRKFGTLGAQFLARDDKRIYLSVRDYERARAERSRDAA
jgi:hypothetical protein